MLSELSVQQFKEWIAFNRIEPFGDEWRQAGMLAAVQHNCHARKAAQPEDFMPTEKRHDNTAARKMLERIARPANKPNATA